MTPRELRIQGLHAYYGTAHVLFGIDLTVPAGSSLALLGRNGAGKTTLLRCLASADIARRGEIHYGESAVHELNSFQVARGGIQLVPDDRRIFASLTVRDNLRLAQAAVRRRRGAEGRTPLPVQRLVEIFPLLEKLLDRRGFALSGGEQQLVAIARAMVANPTLLLLDEPAEGLAPLIVAQVGDAIRRLRDEFALTVIVAEQSLQFALDVCDDQVCLLDGGRVVYQGAAEQFAAADELKRTYLAV